jgi:serine/threonine protein kinase
MAVMQAAAPEILRAAESPEPLFIADPATDIWALGVVAYEVRSSTFCCLRSGLPLLFLTAALPFTSRRAVVVAPTRRRVSVSLLALSRTGACATVCLLAPSSRPCYVLLSSRRL